jgi:hypothetical protein
MVPEKAVTLPLKLDQIPYFLLYSPITCKCLFTNTLYIFVELIWDLSTVEATPVAYAISE